MMPINHNNDQHGKVYLKVQSSTRVLEATNSCSKEGNHTWYWKHNNLPEAGVAVDLRGEPTTTTILLNQCIF